MNTYFRALSPNIVTFLRMYRGIGLQNMKFRRQQISLSHRVKAYFFLNSLVLHQPEEEQTIFYKVLLNLSTTGSRGEFPQAQPVPARAFS
jgi:hypothetical protein